MTMRAALLIIGTLFASVATAAASDAVRIIPRDGHDGLRAFGRVEFEIDPGRAYENPFDPDEVAIDAHFTGPDGRVLVLPAFWSQKFSGNRFGHHEVLTATPDGPGHWLVRFAPPGPGAWSMRVVVTDGGGRRESQAVALDVAAATANPGFVRRAPGNPRYLQFDDGSAFFPVGLNIAWPKAETGLEDYERWFKSLADAGGNFARIWMSHPNRMTETVDAGIGRFDLSAMEYYDAVFEIAEKHGIYLMVCFNNHRDLLSRDQYGEAIWVRFPYNAAVGGPATRPADFIDGRESRDFYKRRLRYVAARYSAFTNVAFWEFFNEQEFTRVEVTTDWMREMSDYLKSVDPYGRLVTTSAKIPDEQWELAGIDLTQSHLYVGGSADLVGPIVDSARRHDRFGTPHFVGELGIGNGSDERSDARGTGSSIHNGIWASALAGCAGSSWHWWWDDYVEPKDLWHVYTGLAKFAAAVDWPRRNFQPVDLPAPVIPEYAEPQLFDLTLACTENWGYKIEGDVIVRPNGRMSQALPHYFVSPLKEDIYRPVRLAVDLPRPTTMILKVQRVCDVAVLRVLLDDEPLADFPFSALPGSPDVKQTSQRPAEAGAPRVYEASVEVERTVEIPAGEHVITVTNVAGDWVSLESITFRDALSSQHQLATLALSDASAGETIAWIYDTRSHWQSDRDGIEPREFDSVSVAVPTARSAPMRVQWWDTRRGTIVSESDTTPTGGQLKLTVPKFQRDIALRAFPADVD